MSTAEINAQVNSKLDALRATLSAKLQ